MIDPTVQSIAIIAMVIVAFLVVFGCLLAYVLLSRGRAAPGPVTFAPARQEGQWTAEVPAGGVVVTRVLDDRRGWVHEIETYFRRRPGDRGDMVRLHYIAPSWPLTHDTVQRLSDAHMAGEPQTGQTPAQIMGD